MIIAYTKDETGKVDSAYGCPDANWKDVIQAKEAVDALFKIFGWDIPEAHVIEADDNGLLAYLMRAAGPIGPINT